MCSVVRAALAGSRVGRNCSWWIVRKQLSSLPCLCVRASGTSLQWNSASISTARTPPRWPRARGLSSFVDPDPEGITAAALRAELEEAAAGQSELLVIDVRSPLEIHSTGPIHVDPSLCENVPLDQLFMALNMDDDDWEDEFGFAKPSKDRPVRWRAYLLVCPAIAASFSNAQSRWATMCSAGVQLCRRNSQRACVASRKGCRLHERPKL
jgi:rhodanese-related sulfurtransferase